jgi:hypothetical protein
MQDHSVGHSGAGGPDVVEHLDLVTAELRRRIAGIGLAIAELREETGRLRASADERYHAVAVLERPIDVDPSPAVEDLHVAPQPTVIEPIIAAPEAPFAAGDSRFEPRVAEPVSPWSTPSGEVVAQAPVDRPDPTPAPVAVADLAVAAGVETLDAGAAPRDVETTLTWIPEPAPTAVVVPAAVEASPVVEAVAVAAPLAVAPMAASPAVEVAAPAADSAEVPAQAPAIPAPLWADGDDEESAAFEAFFSAEIEPEPSQRWLLSD